MSEIDIQIHPSSPGPEDESTTFMERKQQSTRVGNAKANNKHEEKNKPKQGGGKGNKGPKPKGPKGGSGAAQPYYQELIMQLTKAAEWRPVEVASPRSSSESSIESLKGHLQSDSMLMTTTTTTTTTVTTTHATTLTVPDERPPPRRSVSGKSGKSFRTARSFLSHKSSMDSLASAKATSSPESSVNTSPSNSTISLNAVPPTSPITAQAPKVPRKARSGRVLSLAEVQAEPALQSILSEYGGVQHGGILDPAYSFFVNAANTAAINFIIKDHVAVIGGDPLCPPNQSEAVLREFAKYRRRHRLGVAVFGGSDEMLAYGKTRGWSSIRFGQERVLNPLTNPVLHGKVQKQIIRQNKSILDPARGGNTIHIYAPATTGRDVPLEGALRGVYDAWKAAKNASGKPQRYTTVYDPFALPEMMIYIYTRDRNGTPNGFAALRRLGSRGGYYIDPCIAAPGAPSRIPDLLYFTAMGLLNMLGVNYLAIGMEPADSLDLYGFPKKFSEYAKKAHGSLYQSLQLNGKKEYHAKFRPDDELGSGLHLMFPGGCPGPQRILSVVHFANISLREVVKERWEKIRQTRRTENQESRESGQQEDEEK